jgi:hypothetical protein
MRLLAIIVGIMLIILVALGLHGASANAATGSITLSSQRGSGVTGWVNLSKDGNSNTYVIVQAIGLGALSTHAFALMDAHCTTVVQMLNPIMASIAGDGNSTSIAVGKPDGTWWFGILSDTAPASAAVACGPADGSAPGQATATPRPTATPGGGGSLVPVRQGTTPPDAPVVNPNVTPTPLGS